MIKRQTDSTTSTASGQIDTTKWIDEYNDRTNEYYEWVNEYYK